MVLWQTTSVLPSVFTVEDYGNFPTPYYVVVKKLENINCSVNEVRRLLLKLKPNKSPGRDNIAPCVLRECASKLAPSLANIWNKSFSTGLLPNKWKCAEPLHKKGSKSLRQNYPAQSLLLLLFVKLAKKNVFDRLRKFWQETGLINNNQFGFLKGRSTVTQLLSSLSDWAKSRNLSRPTDVGSFPWPGQGIRQCSSRAAPAGVEK